MRLTVKPAPTATSRAATVAGRVVVGAGDRVAVRAGGGVVEDPDDRLLDRLGDDVLPLAGFLVRLRPRQPEDVGEEALGQPVAAHDPLGEARPAAVRRWRCGRCATKPSGSSRLIISDTAGRDTMSRSAMRAWMTSTSSSRELEDRLAVLLEGGVPLGGLVLGHAERVRSIAR